MVLRLMAKYEADCILSINEKKIKTFIQSIYIPLAILRINAIISLPQVK